MLKLLLISLFFTPTLLLAKTTVIVLDVNEGQSVLLKHKNEGIIIDTGHAGQSKALLKKFRQYGINNIKSIILTHLHPDHAGGYFRLQEAFPLATIYSNCHPLPRTIQPDTTRWINEALQTDQNHHCLKAGDSLSFYDAKLTTLWPYSFNNTNLNQHSLVINITTGKHNILLMGDAGFKAEQKLLSENLLPSNISTLIVGHHGANDATSQRFLRSLKPDTAVISVNKDNIRGYPSDNTINRLKDMKVNIFRTDLEGDIVIQ